MRVSLLVAFAVVTAASVPGHAAVTVLGNGLAAGCFQAAEFGADPKSGFGFTLARYSIAPGIQVSGRLRSPGQNFPLAFNGTVKVSGRNAASGTLRVSGKTVSGVLGGRRVAGRTLSADAERDLVRQGPGSASTVRSGFPAAWPRFPFWASRRSS